MAVNDDSVPPLSFRHNSNDGYFEQPWQRFFLATQSGIANAAPAGSDYIVAEADPALPNAQSLGALVTGWVHSIVTGSASVVDSSPIVYQDLAPTVNITIPANMGAIVPDHFTLGGLLILTVGAGGVFEVT